ncbi:MAG: metallophosphoesterase [Firmicutes bacterium]|nr:metallophosphoesterase [Bacillota bacterium]
MKKIYAISDLHLSYQVDKPMDLFGGHWTGYEDKILQSWNSKVGIDDIGIIAGDISWAMKMSEAGQDFEYLKKLNGTKIIIRGNHDYWWDSIGKVRAAVAPDIIALQNDAIRFDGIVFAGTRGWKVPERSREQNAEDKKIFDREVIRLELALQDATKKMKDGDKLIVIVHYPPFNAMRDDSAFTEMLEKYKVDVCIYGHLHGKGGRKELETTKNGIRYFLTSCDVLGFEVAEIEL